MTNPPVSIVIPNFNGERIIGRTLAAAFAAADVYPGVCEVLVVDDASTDQSVQTIVADHPRTVLVRHEANTGFSGAVHSGVAHAAHEFLILLNSDVAVAPGFIAPLIAPLREENVFATSPLVLDEAGEPLFVSWSRYRFRRGKLKPIPWTMDDVRERQGSGQPLNCLYASGGSMAVRRDRFQRLGGFLEIYKPFYSEDMDLGTRAWMCGWATRCVPESQVVHAAGGTIGRLFRSRQVRVTRIRNQLIYLALYTPPARLVAAHLPWVLLRTLTRLLRLDGTMLRGLAQAIGCAREIGATRARIRSSQPYKTLDLVLKDVVGGS